MLPLEQSEMTNIAQKRIKDIFITIFNILVFAFSIFFIYKSFVFLEPIKSKNTEFEIFQNIYNYAENNYKLEITWN